MKKTENQEIITPLGPPPTFTEAKTRYHKVRASGLDPNHWYIAAVSDDLQKGDIKEVIFWKRSIVIYRDEEGNLGAMENRCAHRQVRLSDSGHIKGCNLVCQYHGWSYNNKGEVVDIWHETFGHSKPKFKTPPVPIKEKYGLIWIFPGDTESADQVALPEIPWAEPGAGYTMFPKEYHWNAHHSIILENVSDYTHGYLHRKYEPFSDPHLTECEVKGDSVHIAYDAKIGAGKLMNLFMDRETASSNKMRLGYDYPYNWSNTDEYITHFVSIMPKDEYNSQFFFVLFVKSLKVPFINLDIPQNIMKPFMEVGMKFGFDPVFEEDRMAVEWETRGFQQNWERPMAELSPSVKSFQDLTIRKWEEYLAREKKKQQSRAAKAKRKTTARKSAQAKAKAA